MKMLPSSSKSCIFLSGGCLKLPLHVISAHSMLPACGICSSKSGHISMDYEAMPRRSASRNTLAEL